MQNTQAAEKNKRKTVKKTIVNGTVGEYKFIPDDNQSTPESRACNEDAEQRIIGAILKDNNVFDEISSIVSVRDFYNSENAKIFEAISFALTTDSGIPATPIQISSVYFSSGDGLNKTMQRKMEEMLSGVTYSTNFIALAELVADLAKRRRAYAALKAGSEAALDPRNKDYANDVFTALEGDGDARNKSIDTISVLDKIMSDAQRVAIGEVIDDEGLRSGFQDIDRLASPFCPGNYITLAAPTGNGKTSLALQLAYNVAKTGEPVLYMTMEMSAEALLRKLLYMVAAVDLRKFNQRSLGDKDIRALVEAQAILRALPIHIIDEKALTAERVFSVARSQVRTRGIKAVFLDYFGKMAKARGYSGTQDEANARSNRLQEIAAKLNIPFFILHQLNREIYKRPNKTPILTDLRDTGAIENDSDLVFFIQKNTFPISLDEPDAAQSQDKHLQWQREMEKAEGKSTVWLAKDRQTGATGKVELSYDGVGQFYGAYRGLTAARE